MTKEQLQRAAKAALIDNAERIVTWLPVYVLRRIVIKNEWQKNNGAYDTAVWVARAVERYQLSKPYIYAIIGKTKNNKVN